MRIILILVLIQFHYQVLAQNYIPYYNLINEAEFSIYHKNYESATKQLRQAFQLEKPHAKDAYLLAFCLDEIDADIHTKEIKELLLYSSENNGRPSYWLLQQPLKTEFSTSFLKTIEQNEERQRNAVLIIRDTVDYFLEKDQEFRSVLQDSIEVYFGSNSSEYQDFELMSARQDSIYQTDFFNYIKSNGYPGIYRSGEDRIATVLLHIHLDLFSEYRAFLFKELKRGNIQPYFYGRMVDRINCIINKKAFYYAYPVGKICLPSIEEIIRNRISIGMSPYFKGPRRFVNISKSTLLIIP